MAEGLLARTLRAFGVVAESGGAPLESRSGAWVGRVRTSGGAPAFLKVVSAAAGAATLVDTRRELRFYRELAPVVPVRVPPLLDGWEGADGVALLLGFAGEPRPVADWTPEHWATLGRELAALHAMVPPAEGWQRPDPLLAALADPDLPAVETFWARALPELPALLAAVDVLRRRMAAPAPVFGHGDCHTENLVLADGTPVFCDWQTAGVGRPVSDLAFLSVRATPGGTVVPRTLLDGYLAHRAGDVRTWERALVAEELATYVWLWPPFAAYNTPEAVARVRRRARGLAERFLASAG
ncbi:Phosphotransferase enzyme family protein [Streptomyces zhaozhouensis]|uniref:Phosphotransferase enzyme family protein n=1 Tax=Streptomyces zhaozhouensis TaxID=1300267 RepID=A0A286DYB0_9ACTN|nr:aminoglycoside phosphotransferase family protein [Streptomyces zhaozhouensis]SOD63645.1 Phosphotransferase enzyme family protein [Streptomyces zhaozhouensis]